MGVGVLLLAASTVLALVIEALVAAGHWRQNQASVTDHFGELERPQYATGCGDAANWSLFEGGAPAPAAPLAIVRGQAPEPTILVSDEIAACGAHVRRLRFFDSSAGEDAREDESMVSSIIQSEMLLLHDGGDVNPRYLRSQWHCLMLAALSCDAPMALQRVCVLGHGAGALSSFLHTVLGCKVTAVDRSADVALLSRAYFGSTIHVHVCDAAHFITRQSGGSEAFDAVFVDVDALDCDPLGAPPQLLYSSEVVLALARVSPIVIINVLGAGDGIDNCLGHSEQNKVQSAFASNFKTAAWFESPLCNNRVLVAGQRFWPPEATSDELGRASQRWIQQQPSDLKRTLLGWEMGSTFFCTSYR